MTASASPSIKMKISWKIWVILLLSIAGLFLILVLFLMYQREVLDSIESKARKYLNHVERQLESRHEKLAETKWIYSINSTSDNWNNIQSQNKLYMNLIQELQHNLTTDPTYRELLTVSDKVSKRKFDIILKYNCGIKFLKLQSSFKLKSLNELLKTVNELWNVEAVKIKRTMELTKLNANWSMKVYYEYETQLATTYWLEFHDEMSSLLKTYLKPYVQLINENVLLNKFSSYKDFLLVTQYELNIKPELERLEMEEELVVNDDEQEEDPKFLTPTDAKIFIRQMYDLWYNLKPLYDELHAYVRVELGDIYGLESEDSSSSGSVEDEISGSPPGLSSVSGAAASVGEPIQEQFFGFTGTHETAGWTKIYNLTRPYSSVDIDPDEKIRKYDALSLVKLIEDYLVQLEFPPMEPNFWSESIFIDGGTSSSGAVNCSISSVYESNDSNQLKIAICGQQDELMNMETFKKIARLMIRVKCQIMQRDLPFWFRVPVTNALRRGFEEAIILALTRPSQLSKLGLIYYPEDKPCYLNYLYKEALQDLPVMIQSLATIRFTLEFFTAGMQRSLSSSPDSFNRRWWMLRQNLVGVKPPQSRLHSSLVDFTSILTTNQNPLEDYIAIVLKYQIYKALCIWALESDGTVEDLETCDITRSSANGSQNNNKLASVIALGSSKSWVDILKLITNETKLESDPMVDYFEPLHEYLEDRNERRGLQIGWPMLLRADPLDIMLRAQS